MGKSKPPLVPGGSTPMPAARGINAYQKTMGKNQDQDDPFDAFAGSVEKKDAPAEEGLIKTGRSLTPVPGFEKKPEGTAKTPSSSKFKRAAQFLVLIGSEDASRILSRLDPIQVEAISKEIVTLKKISAEEAESVMEEFRSLLTITGGFSGSSRGGVDEARKLLYAAFGPDNGETILLKAVPEAAKSPFDFLADFSGEQLSLLFKDESPAACAMVYSRLPPQLTAAALAKTTTARKMEIVRRIARLKETSPLVLDQTAAALREKARHFGQGDGIGGEIDGKGVLAAILKHTDVSFGGRLLDEMEESDPFLSKEMKDRLYTLEDVIDAADRPIQEKLRTMNDREIALLLRGRSEGFTRKILGNLSTVRADRVMEESEIMGPMPKIEIEAAAREFLAWFRMNLEDGRILLLSDEDVLV